MAVLAERPAHGSRTDADGLLDQRRLEQQLAVMRSALQAGLQQKTNQLRRVQAHWQGHFGEEEG